MIKSTITIPCKHCKKSTTIKINSIEVLQKEIEDLKLQNEKLVGIIANFQTTKTKHSSNNFWDNIFGKNHEEY